MLPRPPRPHPNRLRRPPPGGQCRADPSGHPRPAPWPAPTPPEAPRPRRRAGPGEHRRQDDDLVASALAGGDCIDDADVMRASGTARVLGFTAKAPSTLGTFLRSFRWGQVRQLDRVSRELLARAWQAGAGPGDAPFTIDLEVDDLRDLRTGQAMIARHQRLPIAVRGAITRCWPSPPDTGDVLMARLREGRAHTTRSAAHFLRRRWGGCAMPGPGGNSPCGPTAASIPTPWSPSAAGWMSASPSPFASTKACGISSRRYPKMPGRRIPYWMDGAADVAETTCTPSPAEADAAPVRLIVRRVKPAPGSPGSLRHLQLSRLHHRPGRGDAGTGGRSSPSRRDRNAIRDLKYGVGLNHLPSAQLRRQRLPGWRYR